VLRILSHNVELAKKTIQNVIEAAPAIRSCRCASALKNALVTERKKIPKKVRAELRPIIGKYL
jgi:5'-methylthioadenosine phosphorylase